MLIVELRVNYKRIKVIGIHNVHPDALSGFSGECPYNIYVADKGGKFDIGNPLAQIRHKRKEGAEILAAKALTAVDELSGDKT